MGWTVGFKSEFCYFGNKINIIHVPPDCSQRLVHLNAPIYFHLWMTSAQ